MRRRIHAMQCKPPPASAISGAVKGEQVKGHET